MICITVIGLVAKVSFFVRKIWEALVPVSVQEFGRVDAKEHQVCGVPESKHCLM